LLTYIQSVSLTDRNIVFSAWRVWRKKVWCICCQKLWNST